MKVKEIVINAAKILELNDVVDYLNDDTIEVSDDIKNDLAKLLLAVNMTSNMLASEYVELLNSVDVVAENNFIDYSKISDNAIVEIKSVRDYGNNDIDYQKLKNGIVIVGDSARILYSYLPKEFLLEDDLTEFSNMNAIVFSQGVVSEYLFLKGDLQESYSWDEKFKNSLESLKRVKRNINLPVREWV